jgi:cytochrome c oxidase subunit 2
MTEMIFRKRTSRAALATLAVMLGSLGAYVAAQSAEPKEKVIKISAKKFNYTPGEVTLKKGVPVILEFRTQDVMMGFNLPDFNVRADMVPGKTTRVRLVPGKTGTFVFLCDVFCGTGHEEMNGKLTVVD